ncbi:MAG: molybdopterin-dependent oxidoreductase, partial [Pseudomonadota bacterium]
MRLYRLVPIIPAVTFLPLGVFAAGDFPYFITTNEDYYITRIGKLPDMNGEKYRLELTSLVDKPGKWTLKELRALPEVELLLTAEYIGNSPNGPQLSTAVWKGFRLYDFLVSQGLKDGAKGVRYKAADGYYASHTLAQIRDNGVVAALYKNGVPIPRLHGFPLRILNPGYYGVKQPAWVTKIEVIDMPMKDYWEDRGWDYSPPMQVDTVIFFPKKERHSSRVNRSA